MHDVRLDMSHVSLTRSEIATLIYLVEEGSSLHRKLSNQFGDRVQVAYLYPTLREIRFEKELDEFYRTRKVTLSMNPRDGLVYIQEI